MEHLACNIAIARRVLIIIFQATNKPKDDILAAKKDGKGARKKEASENLKAKEKEIREKLVMKLKKKAEGDISRQKMKVNRAKNDDFESVSDDDLSDEIDVSNNEMEQVSDDEKNYDDSNSGSDNSSDIDSDEELRLTSTDEDSDDDDQSHKKRRKEKKKKGRERSRDRASRKQREIERQIRLAKRISSKRSPVRREPQYKADLWEHEKYDRERNLGRRERTPTGYFGAKDYYNNRRRSVEREERDAAPVDEFERDEYERERFMKASKMRKVERFLKQQGMRKEQIEREMEKAYEQYFSSLSKKEGRTMYTGPRNAEQEKEEMWERMTNPHLFGGDRGAYRKSKSTHYEEVQKETLQNEIRIRERREKMDYRGRDSRDRGDYRDRDRGRYRDNDRYDYREREDYRYPERIPERRGGYSRDRY